jgi:transcriptional regulator with XRE-family HTH domain
MDFHAYHASVSLHQPHNPFPGRLRRRRLQLNYSQEELADRIGVAHTTISRLERGEISFTQETLYHLAVALACDPGELVTGADDQAALALTILARTPAERRGLALDLLRSVAEAKAPDLQNDASVPLASPGRRKRRRSA